MGPAALDLDQFADPPEPAAARVGFPLRTRVANIPMVAQGRVVDEAPESGYCQAPTLLRDVLRHPSAGAGKKCSGRCWPPLSFSSEDEAVSLANATRIRPRGRRCGRATDRASSAWPVASTSGQVFINNYGAGGGVELPFSGVKTRATAAKEL